MADGVQVSFPKLNQTNWGSWKRRMEWLLEEQDLWDAISDAKPEPVTPAWKRKDKKARAKIGLFLEDCQFKLVQNSESAREMWIALKEHHEKATMSTILHYLVQLCSANLAEGGNMQTHLGFMEELFDKLAAADHKIDELLQIAMVFRSVPPSYRSLVQTLQCQINADWTMVMVKSRLLEEYNQRKERGEEELSQEIAMKMEITNRRPVKLCYFCDEPGHLKYQCEKWLAQRNTGNSDYEKFKKKKKEVMNVNHVQVPDDEPRSVCFAAGGVSPGCWVVDSGATRHMTNDRSFFSALQTSQNTSITLANGKKTKVTGIGSGVIYGEDGQGARVKITMENVLLVPDLDGGLVSVGQLVAKGFVVKFGETSCEIQNVGGKAEVVGDKIGRLYQLRLREQLLEHTKAVNDNKDETDARRVDVPSIAFDEKVLISGEDQDGEEWFDACDILLEEVCGGCAVEEESRWQDREVKQVAAVVQEGFKEGPDAVKVVERTSASCERAFGLAEKRSVMGFGSF